MRIAGLTGLAGLIAFLPFGIAGQQYGLGLALLVLMLSSESRGRLTARLAGGDGRRLAIAFSLFVGAQLIALILSSETADGLRELRKIPLAGAIILPAAFLRTTREIRGAWMLLILAGLAASLVGLAEHARGAGFHPTRLDGPINFYMTTSGVLLGISLVALAAVATRSAPAGAYISAALVITSALIFTYTRGAWIGWLAGAVILFARLAPRFLIPGIALFLVVLLGFPGLRERALTSFDPDFVFNRERVILWKAGWEAFLDRPFFGAGLQDLKGLLESYKNKTSTEALGHLHNNFLQTAVATGLAGLIALLFWIAALYRSLLGAAKRATESLDRARTEGAIAALTGFLVHGLFEWNLGDSEVVTTLYMIVGLALAQGGQARDREVPEPERRETCSNSLQAPHPSN